MLATPRQIVGNFPFQVSQTRLPGCSRIMISFNRTLGKGQLVAFEAVRLALPGNQIPVGDFNFFIFGVAQQLKTSIRSRSAGGMVSRILAVVMNMTLDRSKGTSR